MRKVLKWTGIVFGIFLAVILAAGLIVHEPLPEGQEGPAADALARRLTQAVGKEAWDTTGAVQWNFKGLHEFLWDKERDYCRVKWASTEVLLDLNTVTGLASRDGRPLEGAERASAVQRAWSFFCNDAFWLNAPVKVFDPGTERRLVTAPDGSEALLVTFGAGGVTPGDSYLWVLGEDGLPREWKMWVSIIPVGGITFRPSVWAKLPTGAVVATHYEGALLNIEIRDLVAAAQLSDLTPQDPFAPLAEER